MGNLAKRSALILIFLQGLPVSATEKELFWGSRSPIWNNDGDTIFIRDSKGQLVLSYIY